jgi:glycosyltransferase involved in cell wall biosynthesis
VRTEGQRRVAINGWFWDRPETGSGQYLRRLVETLVRLDTAPEMSILLPSEPSEPIAPTGGAAAVVHPIRRSHLHKLWWEQVLVPRLTASVAADLLHVPYWAPPALAPTPIIVTIHDIIPRILPAYRGGTKGRLYTALVSATSVRAHTVLTDSEASRHDIIRHLRVPEQRIRTVPLAVDPTYAPDEAPSDADLRAAWGLRSGYLLYLGGFDVRKNLHAVVAAFATVHRAAPDARLVIAGRLPASDTPFTPDPRRLAREASLPEDSVHWLGFVPEHDKPALYRGARALICPSRYEGFGYPALESIACGTPVVGSRVTSLPEVVGSGGVLLDPDDIDGLAGALLQLLNDPTFYARLRTAAIAQSRHFSWIRTAEATLEAFHEAMASPSSSPKKKTVV